MITPLDLNVEWMTPDKDDLTYFNFNTRTARSSSTKVREKIQHKDGILPICFLDREKVAKVFFRFVLIFRKLDLMSKQVPAL